MIPNSASCLFSGSGSFSPLLQEKTIKNSQASVYRSCLNQPLVLICRLTVINTKCSGGQLKRPSGSKFSPDLSVNKIMPFWTISECLKDAWLGGKMDPFTAVTIETELARGKNNQRHNICTTMDRNTDKCL